jgi:hypothetical protein
VGLVLPFVSTEAMNAHLAEISRNVAVGAHAVLILDGAGWHGANALVVPDNLSLLTLPPYSPPKFDTLLLISGFVGQLEVNKTRTFCLGECGF